MVRYIAGVNTIDEVIDPEYVKGLTKNAETDALQELGLTEEALAAWKAENYSKDKYKSSTFRKTRRCCKSFA